jgi:uncharacterized membrane protein
VKRNYRSVSLRNLFKTFSYQALSAADDFLFRVLFAGGLSAGAILFATSLTAEPFIYYLHESAWTALSPRTGTDELELLPVRTATFTAANMARVFATGWLLTGRLAMSAGFVAFNAIGDAAAYALNDVGWAYLSPIPGPPADATEGSTRTPAFCSSC